MQFRQYLCYRRVRTGAANVRIACISYVALHARTCSCGMHGVRQCLVRPPGHDWPLVLSIDRPGVRSSPPPCRLTSRAPPRGADTLDGRVLRRDTSGAVTTVASGLRFPQALVVESSGTKLWVGDTVINCIYLLDMSAKTLSSAAGKCGSSGFSGDGGSATQAVMGFPRGLALDATGALLITGACAARAVSTAHLRMAVNHVLHRGSRLLRQWWPQSAGSMLLPSRLVCRFEQPPPPPRSRRHDHHSGGV